MRSQLADLHPAALASTPVAREHDHVVADLEVVVHLDAPVLPGAEPAAQPRIRVPAIFVDAGETRELVRPAPLHVGVVDVEAEAKVAAAEFLVYRSDQVEVGRRHSFKLRS